MVISETAHTELESLEEVVYLLNELGVADFVCPFMNQNVGRFRISVDHFFLDQPLEFTGYLFEYKVALMLRNEPSF